MRVQAQKKEMSARYQGRFQVETCDIVTSIDVASRYSSARPPIGLRPASRPAAAGSFFRFFPGLFAYFHDPTTAGLSASCATTMANFLFPCDSEFYSFQIPKGHTYLLTEPIRGFSQEAFPKFAWHLGPNFAEAARKISNESVRNGLTSPS